VTIERDGPSLLSALERAILYNVEFSIFIALPGFSLQGENEARSDTLLFADFRPFALACDFKRRGNRLLYNNRDDARRTGPSIAVSRYASGQLQPK
jgi:hypothetical protein